MRKYFIILFGLLLGSFYSYGQVFKMELNQPDPLMIFPGNDTTICMNHDVVLGSSPTAYGGTEEYFYSWSPAEGLDDPTSPNPVASPLESTKYVLTVSDANGCQVSESINIIVDLCLGIGENIVLEEFVIYPNPSTGSFTLSGLSSFAHNSKISLLNSLGEELLTEIIPAGTESVNFDLAGKGFPRGVYFFRILTNNQVLIQKVQLI